MTDISICRKDQQITGKNGSRSVSTISHRKYLGDEEGSYFRVGVERQILDWGRDMLVTKENLSAPPSVFSGYRSNIHKGSPPQKKDIFELSLTVFLLQTNVAVEE